jgi:hypothetical protein
VAPGRPRLLRLRPSRGLGEPALEALVGSTAWHGCLRCLLYFKQAPGGLLTHVPFFRELTSSRARGSCRSRVLRGMAPAVPALLQAGPGRPSRVDVPSRAEIVMSQGLVPLEGFAWHGCPRCLLYFKQAPGDLLTSMSLRGLTSSRARGSPRSRVLLAWQGNGSLNALQSRLRLCNAGAPF